MLFDMAAYWDRIEQIAAGRPLACRRAGVKDQRKTDSFDPDLVGAAAEAAVARWAFNDVPEVMERWWKFAVQKHPMSQVPDVGRFHVRGTTVKRSLLVKPDDIEFEKDGTAAPYVCCWVDMDPKTGRLFSKNVRICSWRFGFECKRPEFFKEWNGVYLVPERLCYSIESLSRWWRSVSEWQYPEDLINV